MRYKVAIIDDELHCRESLADQIEKYCPNLLVVGKAGRTDEAIKLLRDESPDLVFLDIHMPELNGFELLDVLKSTSIKFGVIFTTAFDNFALKAFRYAAIDYLLKPVRIDELVQSVQRFTDMTQRPNGDQILNVIKQIQPKKTQEKLCLPLLDGFQMVEIDTILFFSADGSYVNIYFDGGKSVFISKPMAFFEELLPEDTFLRIHRSFLVNINKVSGYNSREGLVELIDTTKLIVSKRKRSSIQKLFRDFND